MVPRLTLLSCAPNCQVTFPRSDALLEIVATGPVGADEEITIDYLGVHNTTDRDKRMTHLKYAAHYATAMLTVPGKCMAGLVAALCVLHLTHDLRTRSLPWPRFIWTLSRYFILEMKVHRIKLVACGAV